MAKINVFSEKFTVCMKRLPIYQIKVSEIWAAPKSPGVYALFDGERIYCGSAQSLRERLPGSFKEQRFGVYFIFLSEELVRLPKCYDIFDFFRYLEVCTISALYTIIVGNGLPIELTNIQHTKCLPECAWDEDCPEEINLAIKIAQTAIFKMCVPMPLTYLPHKLAFSSKMSWLLYEENSTNWNNIVDSEIERRKHGTAIRPPMFAIHPA